MVYQAGDTFGVALHEAAIGLGSNMGQSEAILKAAWQDILAHPGIFPLAHSSLFCSQPVGMDSPNWFVNAAALVRTWLTPHALLHLLHTIETRHGRRRNPEIDQWQDRTLDLDLLFYDDLVIQTDQLVIPHPRMEQRLFVLTPLAEIAGSYLHPLNGKTIDVLYTELKGHADNQLIRKIYKHHFTRFIIRNG